MNTVDIKPVLALSVDERIRVVEQIWDSIALDAQHVALEPWQAAELDRRMADFEADPAEGIPLSEVKRRVMGSE